ncbi:MAG TPA: rhodanese-like domain-containing protein [Desulfobacterales bacterium]|nr:rhodanese-like domain-containing protein [Desulfobacterales bacterium]
MKGKIAIHNGTPICTVLCLMGMIAPSAMAADFPEISAKELKSRLDAGEKIMLLNPLSDIEFNQKHIPGSVSIPLHTVSTTDKLPKDKDTLIVAYCLGRK